MTEKQKQKIENCLSQIQDSIEKLGEAIKDDNVLAELIFMEILKDQMGILKALYEILQILRSCDNSDKGHWPKK